MHRAARILKQYPRSVSLKPWIVSDDQVLAQACTDVIIDRLWPTQGTCHTVLGT